ncbi:MAG: hypothetical protein AB8B55_22960 [Mariniblastus sp.]
MVEQPSKKYRWRFGIRTLLVAFTLLSIGIGYFVIRAERQDAAVKSFRSNNCNAYVAELIESTSTFTFNGSTTEEDGDGISISMPVIKTAPRETTSGLRGLIGDKYFDRFTCVTLGDPSEMELAKIESNLKKMPWVEKVFVAAPLWDSEINLLKEQFPKINFFRSKNHIHLQFLGELNRRDNDELYYYNNPETAAEKNFEVSGETNAFVDSHLSMFKRLGHVAKWNNETRKYEFVRGEKP